MTNLEKTCLHPDLIFSQSFGLFLSHLWNTKLFLSLLFVFVLHCIRIGKHRTLGINWPFIGMIPFFMYVLMAGFHETITVILSENNGLFVFKGPWFTNFNYVFTSDPANVEYMLKTNYYNFLKGENNHEVMRDFLGDSFFNLDGDYLRWMRKMLNVKLHLADFNNMSRETLFELIHSRLLPICDTFVKQGAIFDLHDLFSRMAFDMSSTVGIGVNPGYLNHGLPMVKFAKSFKKAEEIVGIRFYMPIFAWKMIEFFNLGWGSEMKRSVKYVDEFVRKTIATRKMELSRDNNNNTNPRFDFLSLFIGTKNQDEGEFTDKFYRDNCCNVILAGADTVSVTLSWFFYRLHQNPRVEEKIYAEICQVLGEKAVSNDAFFSQEDIKKLNYLQAALSETLRLYPPVPNNQRQVLSDDQLPDGTKLKKGSLVIYSGYAMGRMESIWGKDCNEFKPERWLKNGEFVHESQYKFPAFNAGLRNCLGRELAYYQMKLVVASIICRYRVNVVENHPVKPKLAVILYMKHGMKVSLSRRVPLPTSFPL